MAELNPNLIFQAAGQAVPLNDLSQVYNNALAFKGARAEYDAGQEKVRQNKAVNAAYQSALNPDGSIDAAKVQASLAANGAGTQIPGFQKANMELAKGRAEVGAKNADSEKVMTETLHKSLTMIDNSIASLAARPDANDQMVYGEMGRLVNAGAFDIQARHAGTTPDEYAKHLLSTMPVGDPKALRPWLIQAGARTADASERLKMSLPKYDEQDRGATINQGTINQLTGERTPLTDVAKTATPGETLSAQTQRRGQDISAKTAHDQMEAGKGDDVPDDQVESVAQMIAKHQIAPLSAYALTKPGGMKVMARVGQISPDFQGQDYSTQGAAQRNFAQGPLGNKVRSFNVALDHLDTFGQLADALGNGNIQMVNKLAQGWSQQTGDAAPVNLDAAKQIVGKELVSMIVNGGGGEKERQEMEATLGRVNSPAQLRGVINTYQRLGVGQLHGLQQQYEVGTGKKDFDAHLSPRALSLRQSMGIGAAPGGAPGAPATAPGAPVVQPRAAPGARSIDSFFH